MSSVLLEAEGLVHGDRQESYGHPIDDFACTAAMWSAWLEHKTGLPIVLMPEDVGCLMVLLKMSRQAHRPKRDNLVDGAGYCETVQMCLDEAARREQTADALARRIVATVS